MKIKLSYQTISEYNGVITVAFFVGDYICHIAVGNEYVMEDRLRGFFNN
jgi:hypothetical protein